MPRLPITAAALLSLLTLTARAADPPPAAEAPAASEPAVVVEPPSSVESSPVAPPPPPVTPAAPTAATAPVTVAAPAVAPAPVRGLKRDRPGLALSLGIGITYSFIGGQVRYDIPVRSSLTVSPFVGAGFLGLLAGPIGVGAALGGRHRLVGDVALAPLGSIDIYLHGTRVEGPMVYGPMAAIGYEHMSDSGWFQRATIEYAYAAWGSPLPITDPSVIYSALSFGWRIW